MGAAAAGLIHRDADEQLADLVVAAAQGQADTGRAR
jgi:hypothetical protein